MNTRGLQLVRDVPLFTGMPYLYCHAIKRHPGV